MIDEQSGSSKSHFFVEIYFIRTAMKGYVCETWMETKTVTKYLLQKFLTHPPSLEQWGNA